MAPPATRSAVLDTAYELLVDRQWGTTRMADLATRAGVSRQTLYNEFGTKEGLARAVMLRENDRFLEAISTIVDHYAEQPARAVEAAALFTITASVDNPLLKAVLTANADEELLPLLTTRSESLVIAARARIAAELHRHWPGVPTEDVDLVADAVVRLIRSHLLVPLDPPEVAARRLTRLVLPFLTGARR